MPMFRTQSRYTAYVEGWGLYAERLAKEMGGYQDPYSDFGRLGGEIWRAIRLVVDTGLHSKGWTEQQAVDYFLANGSTSEGQVRAEIRRYIVMPGQATAYKVGMLKIVELRERAAGGARRRASTFATFTTPCSAAARCRWRFSSAASTTGSPRSARADRNAAYSASASGFTSASWKRSSVRIPGLSTAGAFAFGVHTVPTQSTFVGM